MISTNDLRTGVTIELDGELYTVVDFQHVKPGKGSPFVRTKLKNIKTGYTLEKTFNAGEKLPRAHIDRREMQYLYNTGDEYVFMDNETYEQHHFSKDLLGEGVKFLKEAMVVSALSHEGTFFGVELPNFVELKVEETEPGIRGDRAQAGTKPAKLETGAIVQVPLFVEVGDIIQVDTRTGEYLKRV
jgi:elongation factor P